MISPTSINTPESLLQQGLDLLGYPLPAAAPTQFNCYINLLLRWNKIYNLTAIRDPQEIIIKHIFDSLSILAYLPDNKNILDIGTGAGIPGLMLAIANPSLKITLLDSSAKKIRFVQQAIGELHLHNATCIATRIEKFTVSPSSFDILLTRAYSSLVDFYTQTQHLTTLQTQHFVMKGIYPTAEIGELSHFPVKVEVMPLKVPFLKAERHLVCLKQSLSQDS